MKYQSSNTKIIYDLEFVKKREQCPECTESRKKKSAKDLQYYPNENTAHCFHCQTTFFEYKPYEPKKEYKAPEWLNETKLTDKAVKYITSRMISQETLNKMNISSVNEYMPQLEKSVECIAFPFYVDGKVKNIKYRGPNKSFKLVSGAELVWYNFDAIINNNEIIIVEGEFDALAWIENGFDNVISVPNGANKNLEYLDNSINAFNHIEKIYLATDCDTKGIELRDELARRFGPERCNIVNLKQYKDSNAFFIGEGGIAFKELIKESKPYPVKGIVKIESFHNDIIDLYENGIQQGKIINQPEIDEYISFETGRLAIVTGIPSSGKSEFIDYIICKLNLFHGWKAAFFTPENYPLKFHYAKIHEKFSGCKFKKETDTTDFYTIYEHVKSNFFYIMDENDMSIDKIIEVAKLYIKQYGIKILVIDPFNILDHSQQNNQTETQYISKFLDVLLKFTRFNNILTFLVAHPTKMMKGEVPTLYNISGSAHFYNKTDYGFTVHRHRDAETMAMKNEITVYWQKIKFKHLGKQGASKLLYNYNNGRFEVEANEGVKSWDNSNWLTENIQQEIKANDNFWTETNEEVPF